MESRNRFLHTFLWLAVGMAVLFGTEFAVELWYVGWPGFDKVSWAGHTNAKLVDILSPMARAYNNVLAMLIATIGLAIPLTANMHTPKLIDMFLRDRTNQVMLGLCAIGAAHVLWAAWMVGPNFAPLWTIRVSVFGALLGWAALIPYFFYVVRFLDPSNILRRMQQEVERAVEGVASGKLDVDAGQKIVHERMHQMGTIILKSIDRADRSVALEGIWFCKQILAHYGDRKAKLPPAWFHVDRGDFVGASQEALDLLNEERTWFELRVMTQMFLCYQNALAKSADAISAISDATGRIAVRMGEKGDAQALEQALRFFHNYLREAIKRKDVHAIYDLFYQYRLAAAALLDQPDVVCTMAKRFRFYTDQAAAGGLAFIPQIAAFDLGWVVEQAAARKSPATGDLLGEVVALPHMAVGKVLTLGLKAKIILGASLLEHDHPDLAARVAANLHDVPADTLQSATQELNDVKERAFWEVTDRQANFEWIAPERRKFLSQFQSLVTDRGAAASMAAA
jgi:hypothetical protein